MPKMRTTWNLLRIVFCTVTALGATGCIGCLTTDDTAGSGDAGASNETTEGTTVDGPLSALKALSNLASGAESLQAELANMEPVDPVHFSVLLEALPMAPGDEWTADDPRGETNQMGAFSISMASNTFRHEDGAEIEVTISDFAFNQFAYSGFAMAANFSQESTEGYNRGITIGDDPGREEYDFESRRGSRELLFGKRYHIKVEGREVEPEDLEPWHGRVDTDVLPTE